MNDEDDFPLPGLYHKVEVFLNTTEGTVLARYKNYGEVQVTFRARNPARGLCELFGGCLARKGRPHNGTEPLALEAG